jgi:hypothetical protein
MALFITELRAVNMNAVIWKIRILAETDENIWGQMLVLVIIAALWAVNAYLQTIKKKQTEKEYQEEEKQAKRIDRKQLEERILRMRQARAKQDRMISTSEKQASIVAAEIKETIRKPTYETDLSQGFEIIEKEQIPKPEIKPIKVQADDFEKYKKVSGQKLIKDHKATEEAKTYTPLVEFADKDDLKNAIIYSEIIGKCLALRQ